MSNAEKMVMVPRELIERIARAGCWPDDEKALRQIMAQPAQQRQGEPVAWLREDGDGGLELTASGDGIGFAVYTHADPAEVERLRAACEAEFRSVEVLNEANQKLQAQLAEAQALLREKSGDIIRMAAHLISAPLFALQELQDEDKKMTRARVDHAVDVADARLKDAAYELRQIANTLSASAEPSAPVERDELLTELAGLEINGDKPSADIPDDHDEYLDANASAALWLLLNVGRIRAALARKP